MTDSNADSLHNPTQRYLPIQEDALTVPEKPDIPPRLCDRPWAVHVWRSRDNRKGRHAIAIDPDFFDDEKTITPKPSNSPGQIALGIRKMFTTFPIMDISFAVSICFIMGSSLKLLQGFCLWLPIVAPSSFFTGEPWTGAIAALFGATIFEIGCVLNFLEAVNENRTQCFGWAVEMTSEGLLRLRPGDECQHPYISKRDLVIGVKSDASNPSWSPSYHTRTFSWLPTYNEIRTHYIHEIGFQACAIQTIGATFFWISGFTCLPAVQRRLSMAASRVVFWLPQIIGGTGFIICGMLFLIEVQPRWYKVAPSVLGWHISIWFLVGSFGFFLCGLIGMIGSEPSLQYASCLSTLIASAAFLIGSVLQWYESVNKYPVWVARASDKDVMPKV